MSPVLVALLAGVPTGLLAYLASVRKLSGKISSSDATDLWQEARAIRDDYKDRIGKAEDRSRDLETRVARLEQLNTELVRENLMLRDRVNQLERENADLRRTVAELKGDV